MSEDERDAYILKMKEWIADAGRREAQRRHTEKLAKEKEELAVKVAVMQWEALIDVFRRSSQRKYENTGTMEA